jgi:tRNA threonylcarbamoyladenosine biosynthesis protein TsaB
MCRILHIETATEVCSVNIASGGKLLAYRETTESRSHAALLFVFIQELLQTANLTVDDLDAVAVSMGPGSYTGLRIGVSTAKGLCYGSNIPLLAIPTLESMCYGMLNNLNHTSNSIGNDVLLAPMIDARRMEVYTALYNTRLEIIKNTQALVIDKTTFNKLLDDSTIVFFGNGAGKIKDIVVHQNARFYDDFMVSSVHMIEPAFLRFKKKDFVDAAYFEPYYLKDFITTTPRKKILS